MKNILLLSQVIIVALLFPTPIRAAEPVADKTELEPVVVTGIKPLIKIAEHPMLQPRYGAAVVAEGDYLYVIGGSNNYGTRLNTVERIDLRTGRAAPWTKLQTARRHHRAVVLDGKIYVLGGTSGDGHAKSLSPLTEELSDYYGDDPEPESTRIPSPFVIENLLRHYIHPASNQAFFYEKSVEIIDLASGQVTRGPDMPVGKAFFGCAVVNGGILVIGGQKQRGNDALCTNTTEILDPVSGKWSAGINMPTARRGTSVVVDDFVLFIGGYSGNKPLRTVEVFNPREKVWRRLPDLSEPVNPSTIVWAGKYLFMFGDQDRRSRQLVYDLRSKQLVTYPLALPDSDFAAAVKHGEKLYVVGGVNVRHKDITNGIQVFSPAPEVYAMTDPASPK